MRQFKAPPTGVCLLLVALAASLVWNRPTQGETTGVETQEQRFNIVSEVHPDENIVIYRVIDKRTNAEYITSSQGALLKIR